MIAIEIQLRAFARDTRATTSSNHPSLHLRYRLPAVLRCLVLVRRPTAILSLARVRLLVNERSARQASTVVILSRSQQCLDLSTPNESVPMYALRVAHSREQRVNTHRGASLVCLTDRWMDRSIDRWMGGSIYGWMTYSPATHWVFRIARTNRFSRRPPRSW